MIDPRITARLPFGPQTDLFVLALAGSVSHGTHIPQEDPNSIDDIDYLGAIMPPVSTMLGLELFEHWRLQEEDLDVSCHSLKKLVWLWLKSNPNVLCLLWQPEDQLVITTPAFQLFRQQRALLASKAIYKSFVGYAHGQFDKMTHSSYQGYMGERRRALVNRYGYDVKCAAHTIRILRMGMEFLHDGQLHVDRTDIDAEELITIKQGQWTLPEVRELAMSLFEDAKQALEYSSLPDKPDREQINHLLVHVQQQQVLRDHERSLVEVA